MPLPTSRRFLSRIVVGLLWGLLFASEAATAAPLCDPCIYVANMDSGSVSVIDAATKKVIITIPAGKDPQFLAVNPAGTRVYVSTHGIGNAGLVSVINTATYQIVANIAVGKNPTGLAVSPLGDRVYVLNSGDNTMTVIDAVKNEVSGPAVKVAEGPYDVVVSPDGLRLYISAQKAGAVQVLQSSNGQQVGPLITVGSIPAGLSLSADGLRLFVANFAQGNVAIIDTKGMAIKSTVPAGPAAIAVARAANGNTIYTANFGSGKGTTVSVLDTLTNKPPVSIAVGTSPHALAMDPKGAALYVTNQASHTVSVINPLNNMVVNTIPVESGPFGVVVVYAGQTNVPAMPVHYASAVNGAPTFNPGGTTPASSGQTIQFTVRIPSGTAGKSAQVRYFLTPNLQFVTAAAGVQKGTVCAPASIAGTLPNGVQGEAQLLTCTLADASKPLVVTAVVTGAKAPRDDPYSAVACIQAGPACAPVRAAIQFAPPPLSTVGPQRTAVILVSSPGSTPPHPYANKAAVANLFYASANPKSARSFFLQASSGLATITGANPAADGSAADVYGSYPIKDTICEPISAIAAADLELDYTKYDRVVVLVQNPNCLGGGNSPPKATTIQTAEGTRQVGLVFVSGTDFGEIGSGSIGNTTLHEYGHSLGLLHSAAWYCDAAPIAANECFADNYSDPINLVSQDGPYAHPNSVHKERLGWLEGGRLLPIWTSGTYTIQAFENGAENTKVLKIPRKLRSPGAAGSPASGYYYLSYRRPVSPWDGWLKVAGAFANGIAINVDETGSSFLGALLDATPGSIPGLDDVNDGALLPGKVFTDSLAGVSVTVNGVTPTSAQVTVTILPRFDRFVQVMRLPETSVAVSVPGIGTVSGGGSVMPGQKATVKAVAQPGWTLTSWKQYMGEDSQQKSNSASHTFTVTEDIVLWGAFSPTGPPNDSFSSAVVVPGPAEFTLLTLAATQEPKEPLPFDLCGGGGQKGKTVWYVYTPGPGDNPRVTVDAAGSNVGADVAAYTGGAVSTLTPVLGACGAGGANPARMTFDTVSGTPYRIQLDTSGGPAALTLSITPGNDNFAKATAVSALPVEHAIAMRGATLEANEPQPPEVCSSDKLGATSWYSYASPTPGTLTVTATYPAGVFTFNVPIVSVFKGAAINALVPLQCNWSVQTKQPGLTLAVEAETTYWIQIGTIAGANHDPSVVTVVTFN